MLQPAVATFADFRGLGGVDIFLGRSLIKGEDHVEPGQGVRVNEVPAPDAFMRRGMDGYADVTAEVGLSKVVNTLAAMTCDLNGDGRLTASRASSN